MRPKKQNKLHEETRPQAGERNTMDFDLRRKIRADFRGWKHEVQTFNRFDNQSYFLPVLQDNASLFLTTVQRGTSFYRGRIFKLDDVVKTEAEYLDFINSNEKIFEGYDKDLSGAPSAGSATEGRLNCMGVAFLYTGDDPKTVVYELRPIKRELISIAEFVTERTLKMADLRRQPMRKIREQEALYVLLSEIARDFSRPHYSGHRYWFTQYLAGQFINMGFDGVIFDSSIYPDGHNVVFFYPEDCRAINSHLYQVDKISITFDRISRRDLG